MKSFLILTLALFFLSAGTNAQQVDKSANTISGKIIDSLSRGAVPGVSIKLINAQNKVALTSTISSDDGRFLLKSMDVNKEYIVDIFSVGYQTKLITINPLSAKVELGDIPLLSISKELKEVSVNAQQLLVKQEIDRISYDVQSDPSKNVSSLFDIFRKVPLISIDANEKIQFKGSSSYQVLINGKPSSNVARNPSEVFKGMPASSIQKIEIITVPPSKYDAEGIAGIINIITKKNVDDGYKGSVSANYNYIYGSENTLLLTGKRNKFGISLFSNFSFQPDRLTPSSSKRTAFSPYSLLLQQGDNTINSTYKYGGLDLSYELSALSLLTGSIGLSAYNSTQNNDQYATLFGPSRNLVQGYDLNNEVGTKNGVFDIGINYQLGFKKNKEELLSAAYKYSRQVNDQTNDVSINNAIYFPLKPYRQLNNAGLNEHTLQFDYVKPLKRYITEMGVKGIFRKNFSDFQNFIDKDNTGLYQLDPNRSDDYNYHQNVFSLYNSWQLKLTSWGFKAGIRIENTAVNAKFKNINDQFSDNYTNIIPSINIQKTLSKSGSFTLGYTQRIQRPNINQLNPFINRIDPKFNSVGNRNLAPVTSNLFELSYSFFWSKGYIITGPNYTYTNNSIQSVTLYNPADSVSTNTYDNIGKNKMLGYNLTFSYSISKKVSLSTNNQIYYLNLQSSRYLTDAKNSGFQGNSTVNLSYSNLGWRLELYSGYTSPRVLLQGKSAPYYYVTLRASKTIFEKNGTIAAYLSNPFNKYFSADSYLRSIDFQQENNTQQIYRSFGASFIYRFGKSNLNVKKNKQNVNNDDIESVKKTIQNH